MSPIPHMFEHLVSNWGMILEGLGTIKGEFLWLSRTLEVRLGRLEASPGSSLTCLGATLIFLLHQDGRCL